MRQTGDPDTVPRMIEIELRMTVPYSQNTDIIGLKASGEDFEELLQLAVNEIRSRHEARLDIESKGGVIHRGGHVSWPPNIDVPVEFR